MVLGEGLEGVGEFEFGEGAQFAMDDSEDQIGPDALANHGGAEAPEFSGVGEVDVPPRAQLFDLIWGEEGAGEGEGLFCCNGFRIWENGAENAESTPVGDGAGAEMEI